MKQLLIVRHAESSWISKGSKDFDRPLNSQGKTDAKMMGAELINKSFSPDYIISSGANRTHTTSKIISKEIDYSINNIEINDDIYHSSVETVLDIIKNISDKHNAAMLVGHNPTLHYLSQILSNVIVNQFPTCTMFCILFKINSWFEVENGEKVFMIYPEMFK